MIKLEKNIKQYRSGITQIMTRIYAEIISVYQRIVQRQSASNPFKGQLVIVMLIIAMIIGIVIPGLIYLTQHEAKWTVKEIKSTRAFHLAEAGIDRGVYKLNETGVWDTAYSGTAISGYEGTTTHSDVEGGSYRIKFSTGSGDDEVTIAASGKDAATAECRTIQAIYYSPPGIAGAINAPSISVTGNCEVHWGPVSSLGDLQLGGSADVFYPRKRARGHIFCGTAAHNHDSPASEGTTETNGPSWVAEEFKEWKDCDLDVPDIPGLSNDYKTDAQNGGFYYLGDYSFFGSTFTQNKFTTFYIEGDCTLKKASLWGNLIVTGNIDIDGDQNVGPDLTVKPHADAWKEYQVGTPDLPGTDGDDADTFAGADEWYGDDVDHGTKNYTIGKYLFRGLIYVYGNGTASSNPNIYGLLVIKGSGGLTGAGTPVIWHDKEFARNVKTTTRVRPTRQSWKEIAPKWEL